MWRYSGARDANEMNRNENVNKVTEKEKAIGWKLFSPFQFLAILVCVIVIVGRC